MATLEELGRQIAAADDLQSVVRTMKAISAASIRRHEQAEAAMSGYLATVEMALQVVLRDLALGGDPPTREHGRTGIVIIGSDIGLCGAFNERLVPMARAVRDADPPNRTRVMVVGARAVAAWTADSGQSPDATIEVPATVEALSRTIATVLDRFDHWRDHEDVTRLILLNNAPAADAAYETVRTDLFPVEPAWLDALRTRPWPSRRLPLPSGSPDALFRHLIRQLLFARLHAALIRSRTAEHAARLAAMQAADRSIEDKLDDLRVTHRLRRQDVITAELLDLVAGFEAATSTD
jgi:F-type H+-transporting ATPase subunit gamma